MHAVHVVTQEKERADKAKAAAAKAAKDKEGSKDADAAKVMMVG